MSDETKVEEAATEHTAPVTEPEAPTEPVHEPEHHTEPEHHSEGLEAKVDNLADTVHELVEVVAEIAKPDEVAPEAPVDEAPHNLPWTHLGGSHDKEHHSVPWTHKGSHHGDQV